MNVLSLFDGMSCGRIALGRVGISVDKYYASEIDKYAIKITQKNYPETIQLGDITAWRNWKLPKIYLILGGSPCQGFSMAGQRLNFDDGRSKLFFEFVKCIKHFKPRYFLLENVKMKKEFQDIISDFLKVQPIEINSALLSAQNRKRLYWTDIPFDQYISNKGIKISEIIENDVEPIFVHNLYGGFKESKPRIFDKKSPTIRTSGGGGHIPNLMIKATDIYSNRTLEYAKTNSRKLTPLECERLQTVPDNYTEGVSNTQRYKMLGNGWTVDIIAHIIKSIKSKNGE